MNSATEPQAAENAGHPQLDSVYVEGKSQQQNYWFTFSGFRESGNTSLSNIPSLNFGPQVENPKAENDSDRHGCQKPETSHPVIISSGEKVKDEFDFTGLGAYSLGLSRSYRSVNSTAFMFGPQWNSNLEYRPLNISYEGCQVDLDWGCVATVVSVVDTDGATHKYYRAAGDQLFEYWDNRPQPLGHFQHYPNENWILNEGGKVYTYSNAGYIQRIESDTGVLILQYTYAPQAPQQPIRITNTVGQMIQLTWQNNRVVAVTDPGGNVWSYGYNGSGMLTTVTAPGPSPDIRTYHYESPVGHKLLTGISYNAARYSTYSYFSDRKVQSSGLAGGEELDTFTYAPNQTTVVNALGQSTAYTFATINDSSKLVSTSRAATSSCGAAAAQIAYDGNGYMDYMLDWKGNRVEYDYDASGRPIQVTTAAGTPQAASEIHSWAGTYLTSTHYRDANGSEVSNVTYAYTNTGTLFDRLSEEVWTDASTGQVRRTGYTYVYHPNNGIASVTRTQFAPEGNTSNTSTFDQQGNQVSMTNAAGHGVSWSGFNRLGQAGRMVDANGMATDFDYAANGTLKTQTQRLASGDRQTAYNYSNAGLVTAINHPSGQVQRYGYTASLRMNRTGNAQAEYVNADIDMATRTSTVHSTRHQPYASGGVPQPSASGEFIARTEVDSLDRPKKLIGNNGQQVTLDHDNNGNVVTRTDALGRQTRYDHDAQDRLYKTTAADGGVTESHRDARGQLDWLRDPRGLVTGLEYGAFGQRRTLISPDTGTTTYLHDSWGRVTTETKADGRVIGHGWDALGRPTSRSSSGQTESFAYDHGGNGKGRLTRFNDASGSTSYEYSAAGELTQQTAVVAGQTLISTWSYDAVGRLTGMAYPSGLGLSYGYDSHGRLASVSSNHSGGWSTLAGNFLYQPATDALYAWRFGNGQPPMVTQDADGRITQLDSSSAHKLGFDYNTTDTVWRINDLIYGAQTTSYGYDANDRVTAAGSGVASHSYA